MSAEPVTGAATAETLRDEVAARVRDGQRFAGLSAGLTPDGVDLTALLAHDGTVEPLDVRLPPMATRFASLTPLVPAAFWYERAIRDLFGLEPYGHPRPDPLLLPLEDPSAPLPRPGKPGMPDDLPPDEFALPRVVTGPGLFTIPHGPVRSGVFESVEYLVETPGEDIPRLQIRLFGKHRGIEKRFEGMTPYDAVLLAERVEGIASVAHALAFAHAVERLAGAAVPRPAALVRVLHAELERVANHLDVALKLSDAAGLAVATARFGTHKERVLRLVGALCGSRFGRGVVVPGGVTAMPRLAPIEILDRLDRLQAAVEGDARALMATPSFLDRLRGTGRLDGALARSHGALGPVGRASGFHADARVERPYDAYPHLAMTPLPPRAAGDAMDRLKVRWDEVGQSFHLIRQVVQELRESPGDGTCAAPVHVEDGRALGWAEAPQGEVLYLLRVRQGRVTRCDPRSASFHNLVLLHEVFNGDILTDFPFIEASFGLSVAGAAR
ncbi:NADH-quinone oxidoreductase subunit C [Streptomyces sp. PTM05]|uniref:NADH-quinone oxidoreductase subunit C n=1 Tax=Streptantibioticus parmotrematis TaxID=2873249 RepID=A0ABS7QQP3_9ACTN|nr:NADH-quinone oxidoreductase subunit C [Streptantibioticus parmotrematis]MBY8885515.1 NADH-quinone oxidoreductase subunit C [Streptantibioticus parmotrematis]